MPLLSVVPDLVSEASGNLANIGSTLRNTVAAAMTQTTAIAAPGGDEVSAAITALFAGHAGDFQASSAQAASFHNEFVNLLSGGAAQYVTTEVANAQQNVINAVNAPAQALVGHPLIPTGTGQAPAATAPDFTTATRQYGPVTVTTTSSANLSTFDAYIGTPIGNLSLVSAHVFVSPDTIGPPEAPLTPMDLHLGFLNNGFGWTLSALPVGANTFEYSFYATNFWDTAQGFYYTQPIFGSWPATASILESYGPLGPTGISFVSQTGEPFVPWIVFNGSPVFAI
ncbi:PE family protein [Mycobacterium alsense]|nr:PE family protein [Mycobacterium alsense]